MGKKKSKEISQDLRKKIIAPKSGSSLGAISKCLKVPHSSVQTIVCKYKHHGTTQQSYRSGRRRVLSPRDERTLVREVQINPRRAAKDLVKMLGKEWYKSIYIHSKTSSINRHNLEGRSARKKLTKNTIPNVKHGGGSIMWGCLAAGGTGALHTIDGIMRNENDVDILKQHQDMSGS
uniref:Sleeping Beauty transposase HTH domain-containing protein n=1 Tax=Oncorhynchus tshawytscha TaxID=74940 RepID=A0AAZ3QRC8_ONCTS